MQEAELAILVVASIATATIGLFTLLKNAQSTTNRLFAFLTFTLILWSVANYFSLRTSNMDALFVIKIIFACVVLQNASFLMLAYVYPDDRRSLPKKYMYPYLLVCSVLLLLLSLGLVLKSYTGVNGSGTLEVAPGIGLFMLTALFSLVSGFYLLIKRFRSSSLLERKKIAYLIIASLLIWIIVPITNFALPVLYGINFFVRLSSLYVLIFSLIIGYAIVRHKLFDIRSAVARSVAYVLLIATLAAFYSLGLYTATNIVFTGKNSDFAREVVSIVLIIILVFGFQSIKRFFDRTTNKLFYRDAYDGQELLNELNASLVSSASVVPLLNNAAKIVSDRVKPEFCAFGVSADGTDTEYACGTKIVKISQKENEHIKEFMAKTLNGVIIASELIGDNDVKTTLDKYKIELIAKLTVGDQAIGFLMLGYKKSGSLYNKHDIQLMETVADSVAIAAQNALRYDEIAQFNITLQKRIETATAKLQHTNEKLQALDEAKDEFISMASHQLRTPLTSAKGYISMMLEGDTGPLNDRQHLFLDQAFISSQRMVYLIADLLNVSRLKTGKFIIEAKPTYLPDVVESEISQLYETAKSRELELVFKKPATFPLMNIDETKVRQVIMNFADNAIYYTPKGGRIVISLKETAHSVELTVKDDGIGVPKSEQHHLFTKFYRAGNAKQARPDGTGLGLFMAKKVIAAQGGAILFSTAEGKGSTFGFSLPREKLEVKQ